MHKPQQLLRLILFFTHLYHSYIVSKLKDGYEYIFINFNNSINIKCNHKHNKAIEKNENLSCFSLLMKEVDSDRF